MIIVRLVPVPPKTIFSFGIRAVFDDVLDAGLAFLQKPFTPETLARKVLEVLDMAELGDSAIAG